MMLMFQQKRVRQLLILAVAAFIVFVLFSRRDYFQDGLSQAPSSPNFVPSPPEQHAPESDATPGHHSRPITSDTPGELLPEYDQSPARGQICTERFSNQYLHDFRDHAASYCEGDSTSSLTCFHTHARTDRKHDSFCFARHVGFDAAEGKFTMSCAVRDLTPEEKQQDLVPFKNIQSYWYNTGPPQIFSAAVIIEEPPLGIDETDESEAPDRRDAVPDAATEPVAETETETEAETETEPEAETESQAEAHAETGSDMGIQVDNGTGLAASSAPRSFLLLKREGEGNLWHCMMEIFSVWMTFDILRISTDPSTDAPFWQHPEDSEDAQVIITDEREDGPYWDLWTLFARRKPMRLSELAAQPEMVEAIRDANLVVPLAGSSNPLWQEDWEPENCASMATINVFSDRVLDFYHVRDADGERREENKPIVVTFIDRTGNRRLVDQEAIFERLKAEIPHMSLQVIDFADISFPEQLRVVHETDVLVGVHGAGLTHGLFMREYSGAVVEIQPTDMDYHVFRNIALLRGLRYYRVHAEQGPKSSDRPQKRGVSRPRDLDWHFYDVKIDADKFIGAVGAAVKSFYGNGQWDYDVN